MKSLPAARIISATSTGGFVTVFDFSAQDLHCSDHKRRVRPADSRTPGYDAGTDEDKSLCDSDWSVPAIAALSEGPLRLPQGASQMSVEAYADRLVF